jgi:hypothetical protein
VYIITKNSILNINRLLERENTPVRNTSPFPSTSDGFYVMPDFHNTITDFFGTDFRFQASEWLQSVQSVSRLRHWPEAFKLSEQI